MRNRKKGKSGILKAVCILPVLALCFSVTAGADIADDVFGLSDTLSYVDAYQETEDFEADNQIAETMTPEQAKALYNAGTVNAKVARLVFDEEYNNATWKKATDTIYIACTKKMNGANGYYILSHVIINDPEQISGELSFNDWAGPRESPLDASERLGATLVANGSYFKYETNTMNGADVGIANSMIMQDGIVDGYEICLADDGTLFSPERGETDAKGLVETGVVYTWGTCEDCMIKDGMPCMLTDTDWDFSPYPRTSIGMVQPLEYYVITAGSTGHSNGITVEEEQKIFSALGCQYARGLDGGGSAALVLDGESINKSPESDGSVRKVIDFLCFYE